MTVKLYSGFDTALRRRTVRLVDADIKALPAGPVVVIPAPGLLRAIVVADVVASSFIMSGTGYTGVDPDATLDLRYTSGVSAGGTAIANVNDDTITTLTDLLGATGAVFAQPSQVNSASFSQPLGQNIAFASHVNQAVQLEYIPNPETALGGGGLANFLVLRIAYYVLKVPPTV